ncbi:hypothetical protein A4S05_34085 [Nostoc sp. KVJ20]|uniref:hypothetical protein n=1 Tax=Nostoc sp. KVJ20 TaxID=457944 RepID=UPI00083D08CF|nr:hypothetical protein [Nostoc sp. KVJ20]ODH00232.1 hypothetical protein A4S05_34085 [Nostoc sp. KVJ20]
MVQWTGKGKVLHELKIIVTNETKEITVRLNITDTECPELETALSVFWAYIICNEGNTPEEGTEAYAAALQIGEAGLMSLPAMTVDMLPNVPLKNVMGKITGHKLECFPFTGECCPYEKLEITLPKKEERSGKGGRSGGGYSVDPKAVLEARAKFFTEQVALLDPEVKTLAQALEVASTPKSPILAKVELLLKVMGQ